MVIYGFTWGEQQKGCICSLHLRNFLWLAISEFFLESYADCDINIQILYIYLKLKLGTPKYISLK